MGLTSEAMGEAATTSPAASASPTVIGECIYAACPHTANASSKAVRAAQEPYRHRQPCPGAATAIDQALGPAETTEEQEQTGAMRRLIFDEGHHLFDAADSAFSGHLTGIETAELRRWIRRPEAQGRRGRALPTALGSSLPTTASRRSCWGSCSERRSAARTRMDAPRSGRHA